MQNIVVSFNKISGTTERHHVGLTLASCAKINDYLLATNPRAKFVCNFPQEIYRGTSLPAAVPSSVSPLSRGAARARGGLRATGFCLPLPIFSTRPPATPTASPAQPHPLEKRKNVVSSRTVAGLPSSIPL